MPAALLGRIALCLAIATPGIVLRISGIELLPVIELLIFGAAVVAAAFLLGWAAEAARKDISGALAIALLALIAVLPEFAVDLYYAFRSGSDASYAQFAAANMTGSNRLLLGFGWPLIVIIGLLVARRAATRAGRPSPTSITLAGGTRLDLGFLAILAALGFVIPVLAEIPLWFGIALVAVFVLYLWRAGQSEDEGEEEYVGAAKLIADLPQRTRRITVISLFLVAAAIILASAEPFAEALVASGSVLGIDSFFLVQWLAPLASEAPEFIIAVMFALRGKGSAAIGMLIAAKVNQWSLLVGALPVAHWLGGGGTALPMDARQVEEFVLTSTQALLGVAIILSLRFHWSWAVGLFALFAVQFALVEPGQRYVLAIVQASVAVVALVLNRRHLIPTLSAPFRRPRASTAPASTGDSAEDRTSQPTSA